MTLPPEVLCHICSFLKARDLWDRPALFPYINPRNITDQELVDACMEGKLDFIKHIFEGTNCNNWYELGFLRAASFGHLPVLQYLYTKIKPSYPRESNFLLSPFETAANYGHLHVLQWLTDAFQLIKEHAIKGDHFAFRYAAAKGHLPVLQWMTKRFKFTKQDATVCNNFVFTETAKHGHLHVLKWWVDHFKITDNDVKLQKSETLYNAGRYGHIHVLEWLKNTFTYTLTHVYESNMLGGLASAGQLDALKWVINIFQISVQDLESEHTQIFSEAAHNGHLHIIQWWTETYQVTRNDISDWNNVFLPAANGGHIDFLKWITETFQLTIDDVRQSLQSFSSYFWRPSVVEWTHAQFGLPFSEHVVEPISS